MQALSLLAVFAAGCCSSDPADLRDPSADVRRSTMACVAVAGVEDRDPALRQAAAEAALRLSDPAVEPDPASRGAALRVLAYLEVRSARPLLARRAGGAEADPNPRVRASAVAGLGALSGAEATGTLLAALRDRSREVRLAAARELGRPGSGPPGGDVDRALIEVLRDEAPEVRLVARRSLRSRLRTDLGLDAETWAAWLRGRVDPTPPPPALPPPPPLEGPDEEVPEAVGPDELLGPDEAAGPDEATGPDEAPRTDEAPRPAETAPAPHAEEAPR